MLYSYENDFGDDLVFWSNATGDLHHGDQIDESDLPNELQRAFDELWSDGYSTCCYLVAFKGHYGVMLEAVYDSGYAHSICIAYSELLNRVERKCQYVSKEYPQYDVAFGKDTLSWSNGEADSQLLVFVPWDISKETFSSLADWLEATVYDL